MKFSTTFVALAGVSSANAALRGVLPAHMKELLQDKYAAVVGSSGKCKAVRNQLCKVGGNDYQCADAYGVKNTCMDNTKVNDIFTSVCAANDISTKEEIHFVEEATAPDSNCKVLSENDGCVPNWVTVGLQCQDGLTCVGFEASSTIGEPDTLGKCKVEADRSEERAPGRAVQCTNFVDHKWKCTNTQDCKQYAPTQCDVTCSKGKCVSSTDDEEEEEFAKIKELLNDKFAATPEVCNSLQNKPCSNQGDCNHVRNNSGNVHCNGYTCSSENKCRIHDEEGVTAN